MRDKLLAAVNKYDAKQLRLSLKNRKRFYNVHALYMYLEGVNRACTAYADSEETISDDLAKRQALLGSFCGQLLDVCLAALGLDKSTDAEQRFSL